MTHQLAYLTAQQRAADQAPQRHYAPRVAAQLCRVSVRFVDVVGSMPISEVLGAEEWWSVMAQMFMVLSEGVEDFDGWVDSFTGDGVAAVFASGEQRSHPLRACSAALALSARIGALGTELRRERGVALSVRLGINSGDVVVGRVGHANSARVVAIGHAAGIAKRIESNRWRVREPCT